MIGDDPNPFLDPGPFGEVRIQDILIECTLTEVDGATKPEDWNLQKGTKSKGSTASWKGTKSAETLKLKFKAHDGPSFQAMTDMLALVRPKLGDKPPSLHIDNAIINWGGIHIIALKQPPSPKHDKSNAWEFEWEFIENDPSKEVATGPADPAKPEAKDPPTAQSAADKEIADLTKQVASL
jgi:hypothetical protein